VYNRCGGFGAKIHSEGRSKGFGAECAKFGSVGIAKGGEKLAIVVGEDSLSKDVGTVG